MVAVVGRGEPGELVLVSIPVKVAAVHDCTANLCCMSVHVLGGGVGDDVGSPLEWAAVDGCGECIVDNQGYTVPVSHVGKALDVEYLASGVGDCCLYLLVIPLGVDEGALDAEFLERNTEQVERASVYVVGRDDVAACLTDIEDGIEIGSLSAGCQHAAYTAFKGGYLLCNGIVGGVCKTCIEISVVLQVKQACHLVACLITERGALVDGELLGLAFLGFPSAVDADGLKVLFHIIISNYCTKL